MKLALILGFCLALASARLPGFEEWSWDHDLESDQDRCQISSRLVKTFDNVKLPMNLPSCYTVLLKDCSSNPKFVVLMRKLSQETDKKEIKILTRTHKILLTPSQYDERIRVVVNGQELPMINGEIELLVNGYPLRIVKEGQQQVKLISTRTGMKLRFDGHVCDIKLPEVTRNVHQLCGLCEPSKVEFTNVYESNHLLSSPVEFQQLLRKYVTGDCRYSKYQTEDEECTRFNPFESFLEHDNLYNDYYTTPYQPSSKWFSDDLLLQSRTWLSENIFDIENDENKCKVSSHQLKTLDNQRLPIHLPNCYTVLLKDCSTDPKFVILMRKLSPNSEEKEIKILTKTHKIVLTPSQQDGRIRVIVNGEERPLISGRIQLTVNGYPLYIVKEGIRQIKLVSLRTGMKLRFDGHVCDIKLPETIRRAHQLCGLCEISKFELNNEVLSTPSDIRRVFIKYITNDCRYSKFQSEEEECRRYNPFKLFSSSLLNPSESYEYTQEEILSPYTRSSKWFSDEFFQQSPKWLSDNIFDDVDEEEIYSNRYNKYEFSTIGNKRPLLKHKVVERADEVCVSLVRIPQCPFNTVPEQKVVKRVPFHCVDRNEPRVWKYESRIRSGEPIPEIQRLTPSMTRTEVIPIKCNPIY